MALKSAIGLNRLEDVLSLSPLYNMACVYDEIFGVDDITGFLETKEARALGARVLLAGLSWKHRLLRLAIWRYATTQKYFGLWWNS